MDLVDVATRIYCAAIESEGLRLQNEADVVRIAGLAVRAARAIETEVVHGDASDVVSPAGRTP